MIPVKRHWHKGHSDRMKRRNPNDDTAAAKAMVAFRSTHPGRTCTW